MDMYRRVVLSLLSCCCLSLSAQTIDWSKSAVKPKADSIEKKILEPAKYVVTYTYRYAKDAKYPDEKREGLTVLEIGDRYNRFCDYYTLKFDSLTDEISRGKISLNEYTSMALSSLKKSKFEENIVIDLHKNEATVQRTAGGTTKYQYEEACPQLKWDLLPGDTVISGYHCSKATTRMYGRDYVAWYAPEITMPYGPYKFGGLPGLILSVTDTADNFEFTLDGLQKTGNFTPVYLWSSKDIVKASRDKVRKIYKNYCADPVGALTSDGSVTVSDDVKATVESKPYNPIELE